MVVQHVQPGQKLHQTLQTQSALTKTYRSLTVPLRLTDCVTQFSVRKPGTNKLPTREHNQWATPFEMPTCKSPCKEFNHKYST